MKIIVLLAFIEMYHVAPRCSRVGWVVSRRQHCPLSTQSMYRWSCVEAQHIKAAQVYWTLSMWRIFRHCWRSGLTYVTYTGASESIKTPLLFAHVQRI